MWVFYSLSLSIIEPMSDDEFSFLINILIERKMWTSKIQGFLIQKLIKLNIPGDASKKYWLNFLSNIIILVLNYSLLYVLQRCVLENIVNKHMLFLFPSFSLFRLSGIEENMRTFAIFVPVNPNGNLAFFYYLCSWAQNFG